LVTGQFSQVSQCKPVSCGEPDDVANAHRPSGSMVFKDEITYTCADGFTLNGKPDGSTKFDAKCKKDGKFTKLKSCHPKVCCQVQERRQVHQIEIVPSEDLWPSQQEDQCHACNYCQRGSNRLPPSY